MIILTIRTDKPEAEIGIYQDGSEKVYRTWTAHRKLAETIHATIADVLNEAGSELKNIEGIVCFKGPGSFTGLRIGLTVGNALAHSLRVPVVATAGEDWQTDGIRRIGQGENDVVAMPEYGAQPFTTKPKK